MEQASDNIGPWFSQLVHPHSLLYVASYPVFVTLAHKLLVGVGFKNPVVNQHLLTTQVLRFGNAVICAAVGFYSLWKNPKFLSDPFANHNLGPEVDFVARFVGCGFHLIDIFDLPLAYLFGYMREFRWDLIVHHLSVLFLGVAYNYIRAEGCMCLLFLSDVLPIPTFFVLLMRALLAENLCSPITAVRFSTFSKALRLAMILFRMPCWFFFANSTIKDIIHKGWEKTSIPQIMILMFVLFILCIDIKWSKQMIVGLRYSRQKLYEVTEIKPKQS
eukprot:c5795_g1_i1.p1 GENE.c5795_g1_i1~~c5795_g1_i1.p1  ORF type:complete len:274 (+),score=48.99 c5795_g1_i1:60-881(+)